MESRPWLVHLESWNEFFEGTCICETAEFGRQYIEMTRTFADAYRATAAGDRTEADRGMRLRRAMPDPRTVAVEYSQDEVISTASHQEDVLLWRVFKGKASGFYIDVGAGDPNYGSITQWFYRMGWRGINIEPHAGMFPVLAQWRPEDINLNVGVSDEPGVLTFYEAQADQLGQGWGLSSFDLQAATKVRQMGYEVRETPIKIMTLQQIAEQYCQGREVDLLKIDVEGYEPAVLRSATWSRFRPRVMCIAATFPMSTTPTFARWEHVLLGANYEYMLFDGINNYYVRGESPEFFPQFNCGVNSGDRWRPATRNDFVEPWLGVASATEPESNAADRLSGSRSLFAQDPVARGIVYEPDVYRSYEDSDLDLLREFVDPSVKPVPGCFTDFLGRITECRFLPSIAHLEGRASTDIPVPGDGFYADTIEYVGLLLAYKTLRRDGFVAVECGAGWGPWTAAAGVIGRRRGIGNIELVALEASGGKIELIKQHLVDNRLRPDVPDLDTRLGSFHCRCVRGAVWSADGEVKFPLVAAEQEYGGAVTEVEGERDYRGVAVRYESVPAYTMASILGSYDIVDFMHIDIQGAEAAVCRQAIGFLKEHARYVFIGTHSRTIEGELLQIFRPNGFDILREKPCRFSLNAWSGTLEGIGTADGGQLYSNSRFS